MFGVGFGGGGGGDAYFTTMGLLGLEGYTSGLRRASRGWQELQNNQTAAARAPQMSTGGGGGGAALGLGVGLTGAAGAALGLLGKAGSLGMAAVESENLVKVTFGNMTRYVDQWSNSTAKRLGLNAFEMRKQAGLVQNLFTGAGFDPGKATNLSRTLVDAKNDMVSFFNTADTDTMRDLQSGLSGEIEPLRKYGIFMTENTTKQYAWKKGIAAAGMELTEQQKIAARYALIMDSLKRRRVIGDLERTKDSPANVMRRNRAEFEMEVTKLGMSLMPLATDLMKIGAQVLPPIRSMVDWFTKLGPAAQKTLLLITLGTGPAILGVRTLTQTVKALRDASGGNGGGGGVGGRLGGGIMSRVRNYVMGTPAGIAGNGTPGGGILGGVAKGAAQGGAQGAAGAALGGGAAGGAMAAIRNRIGPRTALEAEEAANARLGRIVSARRTVSRDLSRAMRTLDEARTGPNANHAAAQGIQANITRLRGLKDTLTANHAAAEAEAEAARVGATRIGARAGLLTRGRIGATTAFRAARSFGGARMAGARAFLEAPVMTGGTSYNAGAAGRYALQQNSRGVFQYRDLLRNRYAGTGAARAYEAAAQAAAQRASGLRNVLGSTSRGMALRTGARFAGGVLAGAFQAQDTSTDLQKAGYGRGVSNTVGVGGGILTAGILTAALVPAAVAAAGIAAPLLIAAAPIIATASLARFGINKLYNDKLEERAERGNGSSLADMAKYGGRGHQGESERLFALAAQKELEATNTDSRLLVSWWAREDAAQKRDEAWTFRIRAQQEAKFAKRDAKEQAAIDQRTSLEAGLLKVTYEQQRKARAAAAAKGEEYNNPLDPKAATITNDPNAKTGGHTPGYWATLARMGYEVPEEQKKNLAKTLPGEKAAPYTPGRHEEDTSPQWRNSPRPMVNVRPNGDDSRTVTIRIPAGPGSEMMREAQYGSLAPMNLGY